MYQGKPINEFAKQLLAWSAIAMLFLQPWGVLGNDYGCCSAKVNQAARSTCCSANAPGKKCFGLAKTACCRVGTSICTAKTTCCSASDELSEAPCKCGDDCRCSVNKPQKQLPAVPVNESQNEQTQTLALTISVVPVVYSRTEGKFVFPTFSVNRTALTAQQTCALLSRFIV